MFKLLVIVTEDLRMLISNDQAVFMMHMLKEYAICQGNNEVMFNTMLRSARNQMECAVERLKAQWRILLRLMELKFEDIPDIVLTCFALHKFCEK